ncbi:MAG: sugar-binding domain-containing protein [Clostridia bacterium]|nr:sugar-binding domain-containing protein [Clostridia bacterium]
MDGATVKLLTNLAPELMDGIVARAMALERISVLQPVGRRALAQRMRMPEREARVLTDALRAGGWIEVSAAGMVLTDKAYGMLDSIREIVRAQLGLSSMEVQLSRLLKVENVRIVPGDADQSPDVLGEVGRVAGTRLRKLLSDGMILAVNGGTTVQQVAEHIPRGTPMNITVLPARGGLGQSAETQASTLAETIAGKLGGHHRALYLPDSLSPDALRELCKMDEIREPLEAIQKADVLLYGIARADDMAVNRLMPHARIEELVAEGATAEVLGYCFDAQGRLLASASGLGLPVDAIERIPTVFAVAAGARKAEAILAATRHHRHDYLVTDEGAAARIITLLRDED